jgi:hypothetical protein
MSDRGPHRAVQFALRPGLPHNSPRRPQSCVTSLVIAGAVWSLRIAHVDSIAFLREMPQLRRFRLEDGHP